jgi:hypothetical protein
VNTGFREESRAMSEQCEAILEFDVFPTRNGKFAVYDGEKLQSFATEARAHEFVADVARQAMAKLRAVAQHLDTARRVADMAPGEWALGPGEWADEFVNNPF